MSKNTQVCVPYRTAREYAEHPFSQTRTVGELIRQARPGTVQQEELLRIFSEHSSAHPELIPQLVSAVDLRLATNDGAASFREAWERVRWDQRMHLPNFLVSLYARAAVFCYPRLNGMVQFVASTATDGALGTWIAERKLAGEYARRLQWADAPLSDLTKRKPVQSVRPAQGELFEEVSA